MLPLIRVVKKNCCQGKLLLREHQSCLASVMPGGVVIPGVAEET